MTIDNTSSIKAYCQARIEHFSRPAHPTQGELARMDELKLLVTLCDGLEKQNEFLNKALSPQRK